MKGKIPVPPRTNVSEVIWSWIGTFLGIMAVACISYNVLDGTGYTMIIGSFGASAVLIYGAIKSPLAQPRNLIGGHILSAIVGVTSYNLFHDHMWLATSCAVATAVALMHLTRTLHPPGGATALIAVIGGKTIHDLGYMYALVPAGAGAAVMLIIALVVNNIPKTRSYPEYWL